MKIIKCIHTESKCYKRNSNVQPIGIVVHSTGSNNTAIKRYSQPSTNDPNRQELLNILGVNKYNNHWNKGNVTKAVHYFIGKLADGSVATVQNLPEYMEPYGCGKGSKGSYNYNPYTHIQFEICEDNLNNADYFRAVFKEATELCADICKRYGWKANVIVSHKEAHAKGYASNHRDIDHWLAQFGKTMDTFRAEVQRLLDVANKPAEEPVKVETKPEPKPIIKPEVKPAPAPTVVTFKKGDKVKLIAGAKWYNNKKIPSWLFKKTLYVKQVQTKSGNTVYLLGTSKSLPLYSGRVYASAIQKI